MQHSRRASPRWRSISPNRVPPLTEPIMRRWGAIDGETKRQNGLSPPVIDTILAATAIEHDHRLVTRNPRDARHSDAGLLNP